MIDCVRVSPSILFVKFKLSRVKECLVKVYSPNEGAGKEREILECPTEDSGCNRDHVCWEI